MTLEDTLQNSGLISRVMGLWTQYRTQQLRGIITDIGQDTYDLVVGALTEYLQYEGPGSNVSEQLTQAQRIQYLLQGTLRDGTQPSPEDIVEGIHWFSQQVPNDFHLGRNMWYGYGPGDWIMQRLPFTKIPDYRGMSDTESRLLRGEILNYLENR